MCPGEGGPARSNNCARTLQAGSAGVREQHSDVGAAGPKSCFDRANSARPSYGPAPCRAIPRHPRTLRPRGLGSSRQCKKLYQRTTAAARDCSKNEQEEQPRSRKKVSHMANSSGRDGDSSDRNFTGGYEASNLTQCQPGKSYRLCGKTTSFSRHSQCAGS
jgi:hypothetical protein